MSIIHGGKPLGYRNGFRAALSILAHIVLLQPDIEQLRQQIVVAVMSLNFDSQSHPSTEKLLSWFTGRLREKKPISRSMPVYGIRIVSGRLS